MNARIEKTYKAGVATLAVAVAMGWTMVGSDAAWARTAPEGLTSAEAVLEVVGSVDDEGAFLARREDGRREDRRFDRRLGRREDRRLDRRLDRRVAALETVVAKKVKIDDNKGRGRDRGLFGEVQMDETRLAKKIKIEDNKGRDRDRGLLGFVEDSDAVEPMMAKKVKIDDNKGRDRGRLG